MVKRRELTRPGMNNDVVGKNAVVEVSGETIRLMASFVVTTYNRDDDSFTDNIPDGLQERELIFKKDIFII